jgi:hypothetical protein
MRFAQRTKRRVTCLAKEQLFVYVIFTSWHNVATLVFHQIKQLIDYEAWWQINNASAWQRDHFSTNRTTKRQFDHLTVCRRALQGRAWSSRLIAIRICG